MKTYVTFSSDSSEMSTVIFEVVSKVKSKNKMEKIIINLTIILFSSSLFNLNFN